MMVGDWLTVDPARGARTASSSATSGSAATRPSRPDDDALQAQRRRSGQALTVKVTGRKSGLARDGDVDPTAKVVKRGIRSRRRRSPARCAPAVAHRRPGHWGPAASSSATSGPRRPRGLDRTTTRYKVRTADLGKRADVHGSPDRRSRSRRSPKTSAPTETVRGHVHARRSAERRPGHGGRRRLIVSAPERADAHRVTARFRGLEEAEEASTSPSAGPAGRPCGSRTSPRGRTR